MRASAAGFEASAVTANEVSRWRIALPAVLTALLITILIYRETAAAMWTIWLRSDTYAHCLVVPIVSVWLIWRERERLKALSPHPAWGMLVPLAISGFAWLIGELSGVNALSQFSLVTMLLLIVPLILGMQVARAIAFPLAFLFFAVPFGDFLLPHLMDWTAEFTILALRSTGIPVYREGLNFAIPSGNWSVVEACSGVRYLIASVMAGTLYAYLNYRSIGRRLIFVGVSFLIPIVANWVRAYLIVLVGHLSNNKFAANIDHIVYGWLFFGAVMIVIYWIGTRWREDLDARMSPPLATMTAPSATLMRLVLTGTVAAIVVAGSGQLIYWTVERSAVTHAVQLGSIDAASGWQTTAGGLTDWRPDYRGASAEIHLTSRRGDSAVGLFIAYYRDQSHGAKLVTSTNTLAVSDNKQWTSVTSGMREVDINGARVKVRNDKLLGSEGDRFIAWQWYWINGRITSSDAWAKAYTAWSRLLGQGDDSALIVVYAHESLASPNEILDFVTANGPAIEAALQAARARR